MGRPERDPRFHCVSIVYLIEVDENAIPKSGDDAAKFYRLKKVAKKPEYFAFDHH